MFSDSKWTNEEFILMNISWDSCHHLRGYMVPISCPRSLNLIEIDLGKGGMLRDLNYIKYPFFTECTHLAVSRLTNFISLTISVPIMMLKHVPLGSNLNGKPFWKPLCYDGKSWFTMIPLKDLSEQLWIISVYNFKT